MKVIRKPKLSEVESIKRLLDSAAESGSVLRRPLMELYENVRDFYVYTDEQGLGGCCALHIDTPELAEIRSLVVRSDLRTSGIGSLLLEACLNEARNLDILQIYCLTRAADFFSKNGFVETDKRDLPHKVFNDCVKCPLFPDCDEIAMSRQLEPAPGHTNCRAIKGNVGFLGFGNMGAAIARGLVDAQTASSRQVHIFDVDAEKQAMAQKAGFSIKESPEALARECDTLLLAVKPQMMAEALTPVKSALAPKTLVISIAAGISIEKLQAMLGMETRIVRVMPNTPALVGAGAAGMALSANCTEEDATIARIIFESIGVVEIVDESLIDAVTALSGSGPAYFFYMVECLVAAAQKEGLPLEQASKLAIQTAFGSGRLLQTSSDSPAVLRERVTSKGGTTFAALEAFRAHHFDKTIAAGVSAAAARSRELGK